MNKVNNGSVSKNSVSKNSVSKNSVSKNRVTNRVDVNNNGVIVSDMLIEGFYSITEKKRSALLAKPFEKLYAPTMCNLSLYKGDELFKEFADCIKFLREKTGIDEWTVELMKFAKRDYILLSDTCPPEEGFVAFLDISKTWDVEWGGYLSIEQEAVPLEPQSFFLANLRDSRWFVKYINHRATCEKLIVVFRAE